MPRSRRDMQRWARRGSTTARGYGNSHQKLRGHWEPIVASGGAYCHAVICLWPSRAIPPGAEWHLGHTPDRTAWTGPEHAKCNLSDGARRGNRERGQRRAAAKVSRTTRASAPAPLRTSRQW